MTTERRRGGEQPAHVAARPGLRDVAELAGVSHQTVSRVFKDHPRVSAETRAKVLAAAAQLDFRPNAIARALATGSSRTVGVVSFDTTLFGPASMVSAIESSARDADYFVSVVGLASPSRRSVAEAADRLRGQGVDGIILIPGHVPADQVVRHLPAMLPVVALSTAQTNLADASLTSTIAGTVATSRTTLRYVQNTGGRFTDPPLPGRCRSCRSARRGPTRGAPSPAAGEPAG